MTATAYRLEPVDERRIEARLTETLDGWYADARRCGQPVGDVDRLVLLRLGAHSIGCSVDDLRDVEVEWIEALIARLLRSRSRLTMLA